MPISQHALQQAGLRKSVRKYQSLSEATAASQQTAFLCHSHKDRILAEGLQTVMSDGGWNVYIDWQDNEMPEKPSKETAAKIKNKIVSTNWFIYLATANSSSSKWCPWEIGYADAVKQRERILVAAVTADNFTYGQEYLSLYRELSKTTSDQYAVFEINSSNGVLIRNL